MKKAWLRVLRLLARGYVLYEIGAEDEGREPDGAYLDSGSSDDDRRPIPHRTAVSRACNRWLRDSGYVAVIDRIRVGEQTDYVWAITKQGLLAAKQGG